MTGTIRVVTDRPCFCVNVSNVDSRVPENHREALYGRAFHVVLGDRLTMDFEVEGKGYFYQVDIKDLHPDHGGQSRTLQKPVGDGETVIFDIPAPRGDLA